MTLPRRMFRLGRHQRKRRLISLGLGSLLMALLLWQAAWPVGTQALLNCKQELISSLEFSSLGIN
jgi:hypothetical protein